MKGRIRAILSDTFALAILLAAFFSIMLLGEAGRALLREQSYEAERGDQ